MDELLNCCPKCGSTLEFSNLMQYSDVYKITRSGKLSKKRYTIELILRLTKERNDERTIYQCAYI